MDNLDVIVQGFAVAFTWQGILAVFFGVLIGQIVGALPGLGPAAGMALLLPITFGMDPTAAIMMLAGILYGGMYGGTLTSVLINVPGESSSVMTALDGHQLALQGRAGAALSIAAIGSFVAGIVGTFALALAAVAISAVALRFNAPEFFLLALLGLIATASLGGGSPVKALLMACVGLSIALIGVDPISGVNRLTFGSTTLLDGIDFLPVAIGLFGIAEVLASLESIKREPVLAAKFKDMWLTKAEWMSSRMAIVRGTGIGFVVGLMPGAGATIAAFLAYVVERRFSKSPERFGKGSLDAIAASETANNASVTGALAPMLALGIPGSTGTAVLLAALILQGVRPGPTLMTDQPILVWSLIASMLLGNVILLIMNLPLAPLFAAFLRVPYVYLAPGIVMFSLIGAFAATLSYSTMIIAMVFGGIGYVMIKLDLPRAPLVLALVLAPLMEESLRQSLLLSLGSPMIFLTRPFAVVLIVVIAVFVAMPFLFRRSGRLSPAG
ncbi:tripartite tricarboxylate transporter permease [Devosia sp. 919]|uniref:tripartite tricarboxylate transporter permease n=1 Tax=Devosia sp. 919 TaxID=2726065 RepID=UPI001555B066|nr:tripartite tricarboxylate transporter permease [Devosia sp. 919]